MTEPPTEREQRLDRGQGEPPTTREHRPDQSRGEPATTREYTGASGVGESVDVRAHAVPAHGAGALPVELRRKYREVRQYAESGGEAHLFVIEHLTTAERRLLKLYHPQIRLKPDVLDRVKTIHDSHVVRLYHHGQNADGQWYEIQELVEGQDLVEFRDSHGGQLPGPVLHAAITELHQAVSAFHSAGLVHRDIKPENILVRDRDPLDLILIDFGLSVVAEGTTVFLSGRDATYNYQAPELLARQAGPPADRWSMGLTIAMLATGKTPYAGKSMHTIHREQLSWVPAALVDEIADQRTRDLCRGLTRYREENRWGADEVDAWLGGADPAVVDDGPPPSTSASVTFDGMAFTDRRGLARALLAAPVVAESVLKTAARRDRFVEDILHAFGGDQVAELDQRWSSRAPQPQQAIAELTVALDPETLPAFRGHPLTPAELALLAHQAAQGDAAAQAVVSVLSETPILSAWGRGAIHPELGTVDQRWQAARESFTTAARGAVAAGATELGDYPADALILAGLLDDSYAAALVGRRNRERPRRLDGQNWYQSIARAGTGDVGSVVAGIAYGSEAGRLGSEHRARAVDETRERRREQWASKRATRVASIQGLALFALIAAAFVERSQDSRIGSLLDGAFSAVSMEIGEFLILRLDWAALVVGTVAALALREEAGRQIRYELAALLGVAGGVLYIGGAIGPGFSTDGQDTYILGVILYAVATAANAWTFIDAWAARTTLERSGSRDRPWLRNADKVTVRRTLITTFTAVVPALIGLAWIATGLDGEPLEGSLDHLRMASPANLVVASLLKGLWVPLAVGAFVLLQRSNWSRRSFGMSAAAALAIATVAAYFYGDTQSEQAMERARQAFLTTPISSEAVDGGFCGRVWTGTHAPYRTAISGAACREVRRYDGWHLSWTYTPPDQPDELILIDGMYLVLLDDGQELVALDGATGEAAWERSCRDDWLWIDEDQIDRGEDTPSNQRVIGTCGDAEFNVDPRTGD